ncbi:MAG: proline--tRNA ligase [Clostridia bacterium]|nr:proline--tRNA ligase [Clostridia bacterium]
MKISKLVAERTKEAPSDAKMMSHVLMLRAGYMKQVANGIFTLTSLGQKAALNIENIIREEMNNCDGQEVKFPVVMPKELWDLSGRYSSIGSEMVRFNDRANHPMLLGMTHEEASVHLAKNWVNSYNQLPFMIYQIQTKFRDEPRSRGGLIRVREFTMKDAYSFHETQEDLEKYYYEIHEAYERIYKRIGLRNVISVKSDTGMMGGSVAHEFMFLNHNGEDELVLCDECGYKANQEVAECIYESNKKEDLKTLELVDTGDAKEISEVCELLKIDATKCIKAVVFAVKKEDSVVVCFVRGDKEVNEAKLKKVCKKDIVPFDATNESGFCAGNIGPKDLNVNNCSVYFDLSLKDTYNMVTGANKEKFHLVNFNIERDYGKVDYYDLSKVQEGQLCPHCNKNKVKISNGVEIGNIFQLGTKYTKSMNMLVKTKEEKEINPIMGCYGIGVGRNLACVIEENYDEKGICMPLSIAPYKVHIVPLRFDDENVKNISSRLYEKLKTNKIETIIDDRDSMPGVKFADADLIGMPIRVVVSPRSLQNNQVEVKIRKTGETSIVDVEKAYDFIVDIISNNKEI